MLSAPLKEINIQIEYDVWLLQEGVQVVEKNIV